MEEIYNYIQQLYSSIAWVNLLYEAIALAVLGLITYLIIVKYRKYLDLLLDKVKIKDFQIVVIKKLLLPAVYTLFLWIYILLSYNFKWPFDITYIIANLLLAWVFIRLLLTFLGSSFIARFLSVLIGVIVSMKILNIYDSTLKVLDRVSFSSGNINISLLVIIKGVIIFTVFFWLARESSRYFEKQIRRNSSLTPSLQVLVGKIFRIGIFAIAFFITLSSIGIDLSTFAFLGGAVGVGVGFGLQKIVSNFISGIIILLDKSVKPGDVIEIGDVYGWIKSLSTRYISVVTREGKEYLIPNEDLITKQVINWSYSNNLVQVKAVVGISYDSDLKKVIELILEGLKDIDRIVWERKPTCLIKEFNDSSVDLEIRFWIDNPREGIANVKSDVYLKIWEIFEEHDIEIPYPQHDLHFKNTADRYISETSKEAAAGEEDLS